MLIVAGAPSFVLQETMHKIISLATIYKNLNNEKKYFSERSQYRQLFLWPATRLLQKQIVL